MTDINNQLPSDEMLESLTPAELQAVRKSWLNEKEKLYNDIHRCDDLLVKIHMHLNKKGHYSDSHKEFLKRMQGDND